MKGLVFNLLESLAREAGCSEEAWDVVAAFAATELLLESRGQAASPGDAQPSNRFEVPAEALVHCFAQTPDGDEESADRIEMEAHWPGSFDLPDWMPSHDDVLPRQAHAGFRPGAFAEALDIDSRFDEGDD